MSTFAGDEFSATPDGGRRAQPGLSRKASLWVDAFTVAFAYFAANTIHGLYYGAVTQALMAQAQDGSMPMTDMARLMGLFGVVTTLIQGILTAGVFIWVRWHWRGHRAMFLSFNGRVSRRDYWFYWFLPHLALTLVIVLVALIVGFASGWQGYRLEIITALPSYGFMGLVLIWPTLTVLARRLHDSGWRAWWMLLVLVPIGSLLILILVLFVRGTAGPNRFGPEPDGQPRLG